MKKLSIFVLITVALCSISGLTHAKTDSNTYTVTVNNNVGKTEKNQPKYVLIEEKIQGGNNKYLATVGAGTSKTFSFQTSLFTEHAGVKVSTLPNGNQICETKSESWWYFFKVWNDKIINIDSEGLNKVRCAIN